MAKVCGKKASRGVEKLTNQDGENPCIKKVNKATFSITSRRKVKLPKSNIVALSLAKCFAVNNGDVNLNSFRKFSKECKTEEIIGNGSGEFSPLEVDHSKNRNLIKNKVNSGIPIKKSRSVMKATMKKRKISSTSKRFMKEFVYFSKRGNAEPSNGKTISYQRTLWWLKKAAIIDNRRITINDVEIHFINQLKSTQELTILEFIGFLKSLCDDRGAKMSSLLNRLVECRSSQGSIEQKRTQERNPRLSEPKSLKSDFCKFTHKGKVLEEKKIPSILKDKKSNKRQQSSENESHEVPVPMSFENNSFEETSLLTKESSEKSNRDHTKRLDGILRTTSDNIATRSSLNIPILKSRKSRSAFSLDLPELINYEENKIRTSKSTGDITSKAKYGDGNDYHMSKISSNKYREHERERNGSINSMITTKVKENVKNCPSEKDLNNEPMDILMKSSKVNTGESPRERVQVLRETIQTAIKYSQTEDVKKVNKRMDKNTTQSKKLLSQQISLDYVGDIPRENGFLCEKNLKLVSPYNDKRMLNEELNVKSTLIKNETVESNSSLLSRTKSNFSNTEMVPSYEEISEKGFKKKLQHSELPDRYEEDGEKGQVTHSLKNEIKGIKSHFINNIKEDHYLEADINKKIQVVSPNFRIPNPRKVIRKNISETHIKGNYTDIASKCSTNDKIKNNATENLTKSKAKPSIAKSDYEEKPNENDKKYKLDDTRSIKKANCSRRKFNVGNKSLKIKEDKASNIAGTRRKTIKTFTNLPIRTVQKAFAMSKKVKNKKVKLDKETTEDRCKKLQITKTILPTASKTIKQSLIANDLITQQSETNKKRNTKVLTTKPRHMSYSQSSERSKPGYLVRNKENFKQDFKPKCKPKNAKQKNSFLKTGTNIYHQSSKIIDILNLVLMLQENQLKLEKPFLGAEKCKTDWKFIESMAKITENSRNVRDSKISSERLRDSASKVSNKKACKRKTRRKTTSNLENDGDINRIKFCFDVSQKNQLQYQEKTSFITCTDISNKNADCKNSQNITANLSNLNIIRKENLRSQNSNTNVRISEERITKATESDCETKDMYACSDAPQKYQIGIKCRDKNSKKFLKETIGNVRKMSSNTSRLQVTGKNLSKFEVICKKTPESSEMSKSFDCQMKTMKNRNPVRETRLRSTKINTESVKRQKGERNVKNIINTATNFKELSSIVPGKTNKQDQKMANSASFHIQSMTQGAFITEQSTPSESTEESLDGKSKMAATHDLVEGEMITSSKCKDDFQETEKMVTAQYSSGHKEIICNAYQKGDLEQREEITSIHSKKTCKKTRRKLARTFTNLPVRKVEKALAKLKKEKRQKLINIENRKNTSQNKAVTNKNKAHGTASTNVDHTETRIVAKNKSIFTNIIQDSDGPDNQIEIPANLVKFKPAANAQNSEISENTKTKNPKKKKLNKVGKRRKLKRKHMQDPETLLQSNLAACNRSLVF